MAMRYIVDWSEDALDELAAVWLAAHDKRAITAASHQLEQIVELDPYAGSIARNSSVNRTAIDLPLGIDYEIIEDDKKVRVLRVWSLT
jgi:hypothetical protein